MRKSEIINIRVSEYDKQLFTEFAQDKGLSLSELIVNVMEQVELSHRLAKKKGLTEADIEEYMADTMHAPSNISRYTIAGRFITDCIR